MKTSKKKNFLIIKKSQAMVLAFLLLSPFSPGSINFGSKAWAQDEEDNFEAPMEAADGASEMNEAELSGADESVSMPDESSSEGPAMSEEMGDNEIPASDDGAIEDTTYNSSMNDQSDSSLDEDNKVTPMAQPSKSFNSGPSSSASSSSSSAPLNSTLNPNFDQLDPSDQEVFESVEAKKSLPSLPLPSALLKNDSAKMNAEQQKNKKELLLFDEEYLQERNSETGIMEKPYFTGNDSIRNTIAVHSNPFDQFLGFEYSLAKNFEIFWLDLLVSKAMTNFKAISHNPPATLNSNPRAEVNNPRPNTAREDLLMVGIGPSYRFLFPSTLNFLDLHHLFHTINAYINYISLDDDYTSTQYQGLGLRTDYGIHKRISRLSHLGLKFSYNFAVVNRGKETPDEPNNDRRLYLSWTSLALDYAFYF